MARNNAARRVLMRRRHNGNGHGPNRVVQILLALAGVGVVLVAGAGIAGYGVYRSYANDLRPPDEVIASKPSGGAQIYDRNGKLLYEFVDDKSGLRSPVKLEDISPWMIAATISTEDLSYWDNPGVNYRGLARAGLEYVGLRDAQSANSTGGSSITQQLVKNIYISQEERYERSVKRKLKETVYAVELTDRYSKDQILEWYLNQISYGGLYNGVEAAAQGYFGKSAKDLNLAEAATLAGIPASPSQYDPINNPDAATARRNQVLRIMASRARKDVTVDGKKESAVQLQVNDDGTTVDVTDTMFYLSTLVPLNIVPQRFPVQAPHWVFSYIQPQIEALYGKEALYRGGLRITTTLDLDLQQQATQALEKWIAEFEAGSNAHNGAIVAMDPRTSEILVMVGSRDYFRDDIEGRNNNATARNSPGSTLKPFAYAAAFERLAWGPETEILDTPVSFPDGDKTFTPRNPSGNFQGPISVRKALGNSLNIPAVKTAAYVGVPNVVSEFKRFGITGLDDGGYGPAVVVGGVDVSLVDVTYAYSVFANNGVMRGVPTSLTLGPGNRELDPVSILEITRADGTILYPETEDHRVKVQERRIVDPQYAYMITSILSDPNAHCITYGCGTLTIGRPWGVKTGTSEPYENSRAIGETWTYGYTPELVAGVWAGNSDNAPITGITSTSISYRALRDFMQAALVDVPPSNFVKPTGLVEVDTCTPSGMKADAECGRKVTKNLLPATLKLEDDNWWSNAKVDIRTGMLATELTPPQFVQQRFGIAIPKEVEGFARSQAEEWARYLRAGAAPSDPGTGPLPARIDSPRTNERVKNTVSITGRAKSENFIAYRVEYSSENAPLQRTLILRSEESQEGGGLALWNTDGLEDGVYILWLIVEDAQLGELQYFLPVQVGKGTRRSPGPTPSPTPLFEFGGDD